MPSHDPRPPWYAAPCRRSLRLARHPDSLPQNPQPLPQPLPQPSASQRLGYLPAPEAASFTGRSALALCSRQPASQVGAGSRAAERWPASSRPPRSHMSAPLLATRTLLSQGLAAQPHHRRAAARRRWRLFLPQAAAVLTTLAVIAPAGRRHPLQTTPQPGPRHPRRVSYSRHSLPPSPALTALRRIAIRAHPNGASSPVSLHRTKTTQR